MLDLYYERVIPRDLFNEANLLKCLGQLYLELEKLRMAHCLTLTVGDVPFMVGQDPADGSLGITNVVFEVRGRQVRLMRPLNSRHPYPLWAYVDEDTELAVFTDGGRLTADMRSFLVEGQPHG